MLKKPIGPILSSRSASLDWLRENPLHSSPKTKNSVHCLCFEIRINELIRKSRSDLHPANPWQRIGNLCPATDQRDFPLAFKSQQMRATVEKMLVCLISLSWLFSVIYFSDHTIKMVPLVYDKLLYCLCVRGYIAPWRSFWQFRTGLAVPRLVP